MPTGSVSPNGKAVCSQNALKSGIYAFSHVIRGEDPYGVAPAPLAPHRGRALGP